MELFDSHTHTFHSHDCTFAPKDRVLCAINDGLNGVCITDHSDFFMFNEKAVIDSIDDAMFLKEKYKDKIYVGTGIEMGIAKYAGDTAKLMQSLAKNVDVALASIHHLYMGDNANAFQTGAISASEDYDTSVKFLKYYADNMEYISANANCDIMCHLTYPLRYFNGRKNYGIDIWQYETQIENTLKNLIKRDICLELNISGMLTPWQTYIPDKKFLELYRSLGGKLVCLSSDSHTNKSVRGAMENAISFLRSLGFKYYVYYKNHTPIEVPIA